MIPLYPASTFRIYWFVKTGLKAVEDQTFAEKDDESMFSATEDFNLNDYVI